MIRKHAAPVIRAAAAALFVAGCSPPPANEMAGAYDIVISRGKIVDGTGSAWFYGDVAVRGDRIARITSAGLLDSAAATKRIDARGLVVIPGIIDIQGQSILPFTVGDGRALSKVTQGVTTEILGEGSTPAPANEQIKTAASIIPKQPLAAVIDSFAGEHGFNAWLETMQRHGISVNVGSFLGAETIRVYAKGAAQGTPSAAELDTMRAITRNAMRDGAFGVASALIYPPGRYAGTEELIEVAKAMSPLGGLYITHMRSEADAYLEAIDEAMRIGKEGGVPVEIFHLKAGGVRNWPKGSRAIAKIDSARAAGQDVSADMYPYVAGGTGLAACAPPWSAEGNKLLDNIKDAATKAKMVAEMRSDRTTWENLCGLATPNGVMIVGLTTPELKKYEGKRLAEVAKAEGKDWATTALDIVLAENAGVGMIVFMMNEDNVRLQMRQPWMKFGTDADAWDPDSTKGALTHPRAYGTYPRILGFYVREQKVIPLEDAVRKMTSAVANRLGMRERGALRQGAYADIAIFDENAIIDKATFAEPHQLSVGVKHVIVNGTQVLDDGRHTGAKPGRVVRGPGWTGWTQQ
jgi:dihydroorotase/N-acyl-D-amino-acid deacylase